MVQWLRLYTPKAGGPGLIAGQGTRSDVATKSSQAAAKTPVCHSLELVQPNK